MDRGAGGRTRRILSWILAALIITGGAIAIGWFAGIALVDLMEPGSKELAEQMDELNAETGEAADITEETSAQEGTAGQQTQEPQLSLPSIMDEAFEPQEDEGSSPFASPPWAGNVNITPIDDAADATTDALPGEGALTADDEDEPLEQQALPQVNEPTSQALQTSQAEESSTAPVSSSQPVADAGVSVPSQQTMYKVRVGPYAEKADADEASVKLKQMGLPVLTVKDGSSYYVQVGAFSVWANADSLVQKVKASGFSVKIAN